MNDRNLLSLRRPMPLGSQAERVGSLHSFPHLETLVQEQRAFQRTQEAKVRATAYQDAIDAKSLPFEVAAHA